MSVLVTPLNQTVSRLSESQHFLPLQTHSHFHLGFYAKLEGFSKTDSWHMCVLQQRSRWVRLYCKQGVRKSLGRNKGRLMTDGRGEWILYDVQGGWRSKGAERRGECPWVGWSRGHSLQIRNNQAHRCKYKFRCIICLSCSMLYKILNYSQCRINLWSGDWWLFLWGRWCLDREPRSV